MTNPFANGLSTLRLSGALLGAGLRERLSDSQSTQRAANRSVYLFSVALRLSATVRTSFCFFEL